MRKPHNSTDTGLVNRVDKSTKSLSVASGSASASASASAIKTIAGSVYVLHARASIHTTKQSPLSLLLYLTAAFIIFQFFQ